jgi:hypothetical protein
MAIGARLDAASEPGRSAIQPSHAMAATAAIAAPMSHAGRPCAARAAIVSSGLETDEPESVSSANATSRAVSNRSAGFFSRQ